MMLTGETLLRQSLQVILLMSLRFSMTYTWEKCPNSTRTGEPKLMPGFAKQVDVYTGVFAQLQCCASGFDSIRWYRKDGGAWTYLSDDNLPEMYGISDDGQMFQIYSAHPIDDTLFRCDIIKNGKAAVSGTVRLHVHACRQSGRGPVFTNPFPSNLTIEKFWEDATFECSISLPCTPTMTSSLLRWCIDTCRSRNSDPRYSNTTFIHKENRYLKTSVLRIHNISPKDLERQFICQMDSPDVIGGHGSLRVRIFKVSKGLSNWAIYLMIVIGVLLLLVVMILIVMCVWGPRVRLFINNHIPYCAPTPVSRKEYKNNVFIIHAEDQYDRDTAIDLRKKLRAHKLKVVISGDIKGGHNTMNEIETFHKESAQIIVLNSPNLVQDNLWNWFSDNLMREREGKRMTVVDLEDGVATPGPEEAEVGNLGRQQSVPDIDGDCDRDGTDKPDTKKKLFIGMRRLKLPNKQTSARKRKNFECKLVNHIPKFKEPETNSSVQREEVPIEEQHLIDSTPSPAPLTLPADGMDEKFIFDILAPGAALTPSLVTFDDNTEAKVPFPDGGMDEDDQCILDSHDNVRADVHGQFIPNDGILSADGSDLSSEGPYSPFNGPDVSINGQGQIFPAAYQGMEQNYQPSVEEGSNHSSGTALSLNVPGVTSLVCHSDPVPVRASPRTIVSGPSSGESGYVTSPTDSIHSPASAGQLFSLQTLPNI